MTGNQLLLYRLVELMLSQESHILPVDDLFEDEQIGDYVRSVQIDSPYQQLLIDGVLTETIIDEVIHVSFTVEGYYHYLLGKVISNSPELSGSESLLRLVVESRLNGINEGVQYSLINGILKGEIDRLISLIDNERFPLENCIKPLAYCFMAAGSRGNLMNTVGANQKSLLDALLSHPTERDFQIIRTVIKYIKAISYEFAHALYVEIQQFDACIEYDEFKLLLMEALESLPMELVKDVDLGIYRSIDPVVQFKLNIGKIRFQRKLNQHAFAQNYIEENIAILSNGSIDISEQQQHIFYDALASFYEDIGDYVKAKTASEKALNFITREDPGYGIFLNNLALICISLSEFDDAEKYLLEAYEFDSKLHGNYCENTASRLGNLGYLYLFTKEYEKSLTNLQAALEIDAKLFGEYHENVATRLLNISDCLRNLNRNDEALQSLLRSRDIDIRNVGAGHPMIAASHKIEARIYLAQGRIKDAHDAVNKAIEINKQFNGGINDHLNRDFLFQGKLFTVEGDHQNALNSFLCADKIDEVVHANVQENRIVTWISICKALKLLNRLDPDNGYYLKLLALPVAILEQYKSHMEELAQDL